MAEELFNRRLRRERCVVKNAFDVLKQTFRELLILKSSLHRTFPPDVILCCIILHNVLIGQSDEHVEHLLQVICQEGLEWEVVDDGFGNANHVVFVEGSEVRRGSYARGPQRGSIFGALCHIRWEVCRVFCLKFTLSIILVLRT